MEEAIRRYLARFAELEQILATPEIFEDQKKYRALTQEHAHLSEIKEAWNQYIQAQNQLKENQELAKVEKDPDFLHYLKEEIDSLSKKIISLKVKLENLLVPPDPNDHRNIILEIRAGTGGDEAAIFVGDCVRMYKCYADRKGWKYEPLSFASSELGGYKEYIMVLSGQNIYRLMQYEAGTHRVQRVPETETQGRVHTSAVTIAVLLEPDEEEKIILDERELKIDTYRASGAGGQHVNTTDSAVRITHLPTGIIVYCQDERSQHRNKEKALRLLSAKVADEKRKKAEKEMAALRSSQVGTGDRSERIRTYNFSQNRVTDHRIDLTLYKLDLIMDGDLDEITQSLVAYFHQQKLSSAGSK
ncbi:MAG: peptide chain release factor 1 [Chlamydiae bacterium]|nr:peptide chain release factor 1 [Chlamydiota bacterium]